MPLDDRSLSKTVAHALRHAPWSYGLELDEDGWVSVADLLAALRLRKRRWAGLIESDLAAMIRASSKRRYEIRDGRIRALYGHSLPGKFRRPAVPPPVELFHGTSPENVRAIRLRGLQPMGRQYVHLSADRAGAIEVGKRKADEPVVLRIHAAEAFQQGVRFYRGNDRIWLANQIPPQFIDS